MVGELDGLVALTNTGVSSPPFAQIVISSNLPQATVMANGIIRKRSSTNFNGSFKQLGNILSVPE